MAEKNLAVMERGMERELEKFDPFRMLDSFRTLDPAFTPRLDVLLQRFGEVPGVIL